MYQKFSKKLMDNEKRSSDLAIGFSHRRALVVLVRAIPVDSEIGRWIVPHEG